LNIFNKFFVFFYELIFIYKYSIFDVLI
jgi:hypothetical protein